MKKIKEIMKEMNNISQEIAVELESEEALKAPIHHKPSCDDDDCDHKCTDVDDDSHKVRFCDVIDIPNGFVPNERDKDLKIIYDLSSLRTIVEPCSCHGVPKWAIRIIGSISFIVDINISTKGRHHDDDDDCVFPCHSTVAASGSNTVHVDKVIYNKCSYESAIIEHSKIKLDCHTVKVIKLKAKDFNRDNCFVEIEGTFELPHCK